MLLGAQASESFLTPVTGEDSAVAVPAQSMRLVKAAIWLVLISDIILSRFGINIGSYFLEFSLIAQYILVAALIMSGSFRLDNMSIMLFGCCGVFTTLSYLLNKDYASITSLILLFTVYLPYVVTLSSEVDIKTLWLWTARAFSTIALFCGLAGILQFFAQSFIHAPWLFDFQNYVPRILYLPGGYNMVYQMGTFIKSNGFFLREPSGLSGLMGMAIVVEWTLFRRPVRLAIYALALVVSYSGSGILVMMIAFLFPLSYKTVFRYIFLGAAAAFLLYFLGEALNLSIFVDRVGELGSGSTQTSGYARFIAPFLLLVKLFASDPWTPFVGHGPGMISRVFVNYGAHDPCYAKLLFEYGALGGIAMIAFVAHACCRSPAPVRIRAMLFFFWLINGGSLLATFGTNTMYIFLAMWPAANFVIDRAKFTPTLVSKAKT